MRAPEKLRPGLWFRSPSGRPAQLVGPLTVRVDGRRRRKMRDGEALWAIRFENGLRGSSEFTESEIRAQARRWLSRKPRRSA